MNPIYKGLLIALLAAGVVTGIYRWGASEANEAHQIAQGQKDQDAALAFKAEVARGDKAVTALNTERTAMAGNYQKLEGAFNVYRKRHPLTARAAAASGASPGQPLAAQSNEPLACPLAAADVEPVLTLGAVWMWNSALAGGDRPAGACGLADPTAPACADSAGIGLEAAWDNQALNARLCAEDRLAHSRLIDFLRQHERAQQTRDKDLP